MKRNLKFSTILPCLVLICLVLALTNCGSGDKKFIGKWRHRELPSEMVITKEGDHLVVTQMGRSQIPVISGNELHFDQGMFQVKFTYLPDLDVLLVPTMMGQAQYVRVKE